MTTEWDEHQRKAVTDLVDHAISVGFPYNPEGSYTHGIRLAGLFLQARAVLVLESILDELAHLEIDRTLR